MSFLKSGLKVEQQRRNSKQHTAAINKATSALTHVPNRATQLNTVDKG